MNLFRAVEVFVKVAEETPVKKGVPPLRLREVKNRAILINDNSLRIQNHVLGLIRNRDWNTWFRSRLGGASLESNISNLVRASNFLVNATRVEDGQALQNASRGYIQMHETLKRSGVLPNEWWYRGQGPRPNRLYVNEESIEVIDRFLAEFAQKMQS